MLLSLLLCLILVGVCFILLWLSLSLALVVIACGRLSLKCSVCHSLFFLVLVGHYLSSCVCLVCACLFVVFGSLCLPQSGVVCARLPLVCFFFCQRLQLFAVVCRCWSLRAMSRLTWLCLSVVVSGWFIVSSIGALRWSIVSEFISVASFVVLCWYSLLVALCFHVLRLLAPTCDSVR